MAGRGGRETNYWPGFVDALTNTVIAMVFLVIVLTMSLSVFINAIANQRAAKIVEGKAASATSAASETSALPAASGNSAAAAPQAPGGLGAPSSPKAEASVLRGEFRVPDSANSQARDSARQKAEVLTNALVVYFPGTTVEVDEKTELELDRVAANSGIAFAQMQAAIVARGPQIFLSDNQRLAFFRAMSVRNFLMKKGIRRDNITIRIEDAPGTTEGVVVVSVRKGGAS